MSKPSDDATGQKLRQLSHALGVAVVRRGYGGLNLVRNFVVPESVRVVSVSDLDPEKLALVRGRHARVEVTTRFRRTTQFRRLPADARVAIVTAVHTHHQVARAALKAGKHVPVDKPPIRISVQSLHLIGS